MKSINNLIEDSSKVKLEDLIDMSNLISGISILISILEKMQMHR